MSGKNQEIKYKIKIEPLPYNFAVCKVEDYTQVDPSEIFCFPQKTDEENSLVCLSDSIPPNITDVQDGWRAFRIKGQMDFSLIGILSGIAAVLAKNAISIFAISTFNTDYVLVQGDDFEKAKDALRGAGYEVEGRVSGYEAEERVSGYEMEDRTSGYEMEGRTSGYEMEDRTQGYEAEDRASDSVLNETLNYYNENAIDFTKSTLNVDFEETQQIFLKCLPRDAHILDFGCGSGRDTKYFLEQDYQVTAVDGSEILCSMAAEYTGISVKQMLFQELSDIEKYDGIWACASILHLKKTELRDVLKKMKNALKKNGIIYTSFKYGEFEGLRNGRYFTDFTEKSFANLMNKTFGDTLLEGLVSADSGYAAYEGLASADSRDVLLGGLASADFSDSSLEDSLREASRLVIEKTWITGDVREGRGDERWLNILLRRVEAY